MIFVDPHSKDYYFDNIFKRPQSDSEDVESSSPLFRLKFFLHENKVEIHTADYLLNNKYPSHHSDYYSFNRLDNYKKLHQRENVVIKTFMMMEPPAVAPHLYKALPELSRYFSEIYLHNADGDGYSLDNVDVTKLRKLYWPQPYKNVLDIYWNNLDRLNKVVVINGNHIPRSRRNELYSVRIEAMVDLADFNIIDLYGRGWKKWWSYRSMWCPYWKNYRKLMSIYRGECDSKYEILSKYRFSLCFENMVMKGYVTEKIFDCIYAGTIPLYLGASDIEALVPIDVYVDCRQFKSWCELKIKIESMTENDITKMREAGRVFLGSPEGLKYYNSLINIFSNEI
jgi:hypothetical protein